MPTAERSPGGPLHVGQEFGPRYVVLKLLGLGGMGAVYQAWDRELGMAVALKVILPQVAARRASDWERRFKQELVLARQVTHKNVIRIHDLGDVNGIKYITMPFVNGSDLSTMIQHTGKLPTARALHFARQIAAGLAAAHDAGVVHRDLKPANILVGGETALITDFGIAHSLSGPSDVGMVVGTIRYMAPEQAQGKAVDKRADVYAFGLILYEMFAGRNFTAGTNTRVVFGQKVTGVIEIEAPVQGEMPAAVGDIVARCTQADPDARYASAADVLAVLNALDDAGVPLPKARVVEIPAFVPFVGGRTFARSTVVAVTGLVLGVPLASVVAFVGGISLTPPANPLTHAPVPVLIADFDNATNDPVFNGLIEPALGVALEGAPFINAYPRADALRLVQQVSQGGGLTVDAARVIAQREGIKVLVAGAITADAGRYRVTVRTIDPVPGTTLDTFATTVSKKEDLPAAIGSLGSEVRTALGDTTPASARLTDGETFTSASVDAAAAYWQGQELVNNGKYADSIPYFRRATEGDPSFARAYASWAISEYYIGHRDETERLYKQAFALSDRITDREKYRTYGTYYLTVAQAYEEAIKNYEKLVSLYPADRVGHGNLAVSYFYVLNFAKALAEGRRALELYPASPKLRNNVALYAMYAGDFDTAAREAAEVLKMDPSYYRAYLPLATAAIDRSAAEEARAAYQKMAAAGPQGVSLAAVGLADLALYQGHEDEAVAGLTAAIGADEKARNATALAAKYIELAEARAQQGNRAAAGAAVRRALEASRGDTVMFAAARVWLALGRTADARAIATELASRTEGYSRVYGRAIDAELALARGNAAEAVDILRAGGQLADLWYPHFVLGRAYLDAGRYPEAMAEFETCLNRRGEASAIFLDDVPTYRYLAELPYWLGRAQEGVGLRDQAAANYQKFAALRIDHRDAIARDARGRIAKLTSKPTV